jgi:uncharacterized membrane protein
MPLMLIAFTEFIASLCAGLFAGAAVYISLVEHRARMELRSEVAVAEFIPSYRRAARLQASLAVVGTIAALVAWWLSRETLWLVGGLIFFAVVPITLIVIFPTNKQLQATELDRSSPEAVVLLRRWGRLHAIRTILSLAAFGIFVAM